MSPAPIDVEDYDNETSTTNGVINRKNGQASNSNSLSDKRKKYNIGKSYAR